MQDSIDTKKKVAIQYLNNREQLLKCTYLDMNLILENDEQVYIALFDMPQESGIVGFQTQSLALVFGLNTHIYHGSGSSIVNLEENHSVMKAMQSVLISSHQALPAMQLVDDFEFYNSENVRVYLKTKKGVFFKELNENENKIDQFLSALMNHVMSEISKTDESGWTVK